MYGIQKRKKKVYKTKTESEVQMQRSKKWFVIVYFMCYTYIHTYIGVYIRYVHLKVKFTVVVVVVGQCRLSNN